jgi:hypothetical protein
MLAPFSRLGLPVLLLALPMFAPLAACGDASDSSGSDSAESAQSSVDVAEKDIAVAFAPTSRDLVGVNDALAGGDKVFPRAWYDAVDRAFRGTDVEDALTSESLYEDWKVVSARIAPCAPLGPVPAAAADTLCWPEVRLVFQPIVRDVRIHERTSEAYADDRAIHAIYPVALADRDEARAQELRRKVTSARFVSGQPFAPLTPAELTELTGLRDRAISAVIAGARALRGPFPASRFVGIGVRPESDEGGQASRALRQRFTAFASRYARPSQLAELTAFSLPEGREPAHLDTWVFVAFSASGGRLTPKDLTVTSRRDGERLFSFGKSETVSMGTADPRIAQAIASGVGRSRELADSVVVRGADIARLTPALRDRRQHLVANTTCGTCHMMNPLRFDFHNFGYLEDRDLTVSPRVTTDVELDLRFLRGR